MCQVCDFIIYRLRRQLELAKSQLEREKFDTLNELVVEAELARWMEKEGYFDPQKVTSEK